MKVGFFIFFWSICLVGTIANGKKFVQEKETIQWEDCEPADTDESEVSMPFVSIYHSGVGAIVFVLPIKAQYTHTSLNFKNIAQDSFFPPPDFFVS